MDVQLENIKDFHENDVLCGKGNFVNCHDGNRQFRAVVLELKYEYVATPKKQKSLFSKMIVKKIRSMKPPGRFLIANKSNKLWTDIGDAGPKGAWSKTRQALREGAPDIQKKIEAGEIKVATNFLAEMAPTEIAVVKPKFSIDQAQTKAESAHNELPIKAEFVNKFDLKVIPQSDEIDPVMQIEPFNNIGISDNTADSTTSTSGQNAMLPPEPIIPNMRRNSLFLIDIDEGFPFEGDVDEKSSEESSSQIDYDFQSDSKRPESSNDMKASILPNHTREAILHDPTRQSVKRPSVDSSAILNSSLNLSSVFGKSFTSSKGTMASSKNTMTSSKMSWSMGIASLMQKSIMSSYDLGSFHSMSISADPSKTDSSDKSNSKASVVPTRINISTNMLEASLRKERNQTDLPEIKPSNTNFAEQKYSEKSETSHSVWQGQHPRGNPNKFSVTSGRCSSLMGDGINQYNNGRSIHNENSEAFDSVWQGQHPRRGDPNKISVTSGYYSSLMGDGINQDNNGRSIHCEISKASQHFRQSQHPRGGPNTVSVTSSDISSLIGGGVSQDSNGRSIHSEYSSLAGYPFMNSFDTKGESQQSLGHQHNTVGRAATMVPPTESFGESFNQGTESFPHNSQSFHHGQGFMSTAIKQTNSITSNGADIKGQDFSSHNGQSLRHGSGFAPILPTPGVNRVSLTSSAVGQGHVVFGNNGQSFQPGQFIVSNINDGDTTPSVNQGQLNGSIQVHGHQGQAKRRQSYCRTGHIAMPVFSEFDGDEDDDEDEDEEDTYNDDDEIFSAVLNYYVEE